MPSGQDLAPCEKAHFAYHPFAWNGMFEEGRQDTMMNRVYKELYQ